MAEKPKGNTIYEICIVVLVVVLIATILYPSKVWQREDALESVCRARMETIQQMEVRYIGTAQTYSDSIPGVKGVVLSNPTYVAALDSIVNWDLLVPQEELKRLVFEKQFPDDLREYIRAKLTNGESLGNLATWDSLEYRLIGQLANVLADEAVAENDTLDENIDWRTLVGETVFWGIVDNTEMSRQVRSRTTRQIERGTEVSQTSSWARYKPYFHEELNRQLAVAQTEDVWYKEDEDRWEEMKLAEWEEQMDNTEQVFKDSIWQSVERRFWDKGKELIWKKERSKLWKAERDEWKNTNQIMWDRAISQQWQSNRKREWIDKTMATLPDSAMETFRAERDSLWRSIVDSVRASEYEGWMKRNQKQVDETIYNLWEMGRRVTWEEEARVRWIAEKESDWDGLWEEIKEELWSVQKLEFWRDEEEKLAGKEGALKRIDQTVAWANIIGQEIVNDIVDGLDLPSTAGLWRKLRSAEKSSSALYQRGVVGMFRDALLESVDVCPVSLTPYIVHVIDTSAVKRFTISCPIEKVDGKTVALVEDPVVQDSTYYKALSVPFGRKLFGGASIQNHGNIDEDMKKSWERRGR